MMRRRQLWFLIFLTAGAAIPQYVMQSALIAPDGVDSLPAWFWLADKLMWALRALIEPWVIVYLFTTQSRTTVQRIMQGVLLLIELGLLVLIVVTVGPSIAAVRLGQQPQPFLGIPWDWMLAAYTSLMMAGAGFAYRVQPNDYEDPKTGTDAAAEELAHAQAELLLMRNAVQQVAAFAALTPVEQGRLIEHIKDVDQ